MASGQRLTTPFGKLVVAVLLAVLAGSYVLVWVHASHAHESALSGETCAVCSWAKNLAAAEDPGPGITLVRAAGRIAPPSPLTAPLSCYHLPFSARSPPPAV